MAKGKKPQSVDDIVNEYQKFHHAAGKGFKERIAKFESFHDPENIHRIQFQHHAHYTVFGKPTDFKNFPGAYNEAYKVLDKHATEDDQKLESEDKLAEILETYVDTFLQKAIGDKFKETMSLAEKELSKKEGKSEKERKKELREFKGALMSKYYTTDDGHGINMLTDQHLDRLKGKKKVEIVDYLRGVGEQTRNTYALHLTQAALDGLIRDEDRLDMAKYISPIFEEKGWMHKQGHIFRSTEEQAKHYGALLLGAGEDLKKVGYKPFTKKKEEKK